MKPVKDLDLTGGDVPAAGYAALYVPIKPSFSTAR
jgi:hypothetical protein